MLSMLTIIWNVGASYIHTYMVYIARVVIPDILTISNWVCVLRLTEGSLMSKELDQNGYI